MGYHSAQASTGAAALFSAFPLDQFPPVLNRAESDNANAGMTQNYFR
jgi:hypothetical protein